MKKIIFLLLLAMTISFSLKATEGNFTINLPFFTATDHFEIYCEEHDRKVSTEMVQDLEKRFADITSRYRFSPESEIRVAVYPDYDSFHKDIGRPDASEWLNESWGEGRILMVSPNASGGAHSYLSRARLAPVDCLVGMILRDKYAQAPYWLLLGTPMYESGRWLSEEKDQGKKIVQYHIEGKGFPEFEKFETDYYSTERMSPLAATLVSFIARNKGFDAILALLEDYSRFEEIMGQSKDSFRETWIEFVRSTYLGYGARKA